MGFSSYDNLISTITQSGQFNDYNSFKVSGANIIAGCWHTTWLDVGFPGAGTAPYASPGNTYTNAGTANNGGITLPSVSPANRFLLTMGGIATQTITILLVDRLVAVGGLSMVGTGNKTVNTQSLPRYTSGYGVQAWLEWTTANTTTAPVVTLNSYTNQNGTPSQSGAAITAPSNAMKIGDMLQLPIGAADDGIQAVSTINVSTAASVGVVNLVLLKPLCYLNLSANIWNEKDVVLQLPSLPQLYDSHCLHLIWQASGTTAPNIWFNLRTAYE